MQNREIKELNKSILSLGITNGACIRIEIGKPHLEGVYELELIEVALIDEGSSDNEIFSKKSLGKIIVNPDHNGKQLKQ